MNFLITNKSNPFEDFKRIADDLMNNHLLIVNESSYRFTSVEFYYFDGINHRDVYSHQHELQKTTGKWYFHGSGLDITFGDENTNGGILIRGMKDLTGERFINGPLLCVQEIFNALGTAENSININFRLVEIGWDRMASLLEEEKVFYSRRVGLNPANDESRKFYDQRYRFFTNPKETQKDKKDIAEDLLKQTGSKKEANDLIGYKFFKE